MNVPEIKGLRNFARGRTSGRAESLIKLQKIGDDKVLSRSWLRSSGADPMMPLLFLALTQTAPEPSTASIARALRKFSIRVPQDAEISFDPKVSARGLTAYPCRVVIGPAAFSSWALLGSTLAHELEVHCRQSFRMIILRDLVGKHGTRDAEREAYTHEIEGASRFGLTPVEVEDLRRTMDYFYPVD